MAVFYRLAPPTLNGSGPPHLGSRRRPFPEDCGFSSYGPAICEISDRKIKRVKYGLYYEGNLEVGCVRIYNDSIMSSYSHTSGTYNN